MDAQSSRHVIGQLSRDGGEYTFSYEPGLDEAKRRGFVLLPEFPDPGRRYISRYLFSTFAQRIPSPRRPDYAEILASWGVAGVDDPMQILAASGGTQMTDGIEVAEYRPPDDPLDEPLDFRLAGSRFEPAAEKLRVGEALTLRREDANPHDPNATIVAMQGEVRVGYVPRQYSRLVAGLIEAGVRLDAVILRRLSLPEATGRWVVRLSKRP